MVTFRLSLRAIYHRPPRAADIARFLLLPIRFRREVTPPAESFQIISIERIAAGTHRPSMVHLQPPGAPAPLAPAARPLKHHQPQPPPTMRPVDPPPLVLRHGLRRLAPCGALVGISLSATARLAAWHRRHVGAAAAVLAPGSSAAAGMPHAVAGSTGIQKCTTGAAVPGWTSNDDFATAPVVRMARPRHRTAAGLAGATLRAVMRPAPYPGSA